MSRFSSPMNLTLPANLLLSWMLVLGCFGCATNHPKPAHTGVAHVEAADAPAAERAAITSHDPAAAGGVTVTPEDSPATGAPATLESVRPLGLYEALTLALSQNLDFALARAREEVAKARADADWKTFLPQAELGAGVSRVDGLVQGSFGDFRDVESKSLTAGMGLTLRVNIGARIHDALASRGDLSAAVQDGLAVRQQLILNVVELYENLVLAQTGVEVAEELVRNAEDFLHITRVRAEGGIGLGSDVARAQASLASSRQQLAKTQNLRKTTSVRLAVVLQEDPATIFEPADRALEVWQLPPGSEHLDFADAARSRPDVESARIAVKAQSQRLKARWWDLLGPDLVAEWRLKAVGGESQNPDTGPALSAAAGSMGRSISAWQNVANALATPGANFAPALSSAAVSGGQYNNPGKQDFGHPERQESYGVWLQWTLSFAKADRIREQRANLSVASLRARKVETEAIGEVRRAQHDIETALNLVNLAHEEIDATETNHRLNLARFKAGTAIVLEVLDAQDALATARLNRARYITELNLAQAKLLAASGTIDEDYYSRTANSPAPVNP